jgi:hypothetical protein
VVKAADIGIQQHLTSRRGDVVDGLIGGSRRENVAAMKARKQEVERVYIDSRMGSNGRGEASTYHVIVDVVRLLSE